MAGEVDDGRVRSEAGSALQAVAIYGRDLSCLALCEEKASETAGAGRRTTHNKDLPPSAPPDMPDLPRTALWRTGTGKFSMRLIPEIASVLNRRRGGAHLLCSVPTPVWRRPSVVSDP